MKLTKQASHTLLWFLHNKNLIEKLLKAHAIIPKSIYKEKPENKPPPFRPGER